LDVPEGPNSSKVLVPRLVFGRTEDSPRSAAVYALVQRASAAVSGVAEGSELHYTSTLVLYA
jgi:hypothetical protein